jgi:quinol monooxygenase YgiN
MSMTANLVTLKAKPGQRDEIKRVWDKYVRDYVAGDGALTYYYCYDDNDPDRIIVFGLTTRPESAQQFAQQPWFSDYQRETAPLLAEPPQMARATPCYVKSDET